MADLAMAFHWTPQVMDAMSVSELLGWHRRAAVRIEKMWGKEDE